MHGWTSQILPSLEAVGVWAYWIVGASSMLEAWFITGPIVPGTLIVDAGGALVRVGQLHFLSLALFVTVGAALGGELSYWTGRLAGARLKGRWNPSGSAAYRRAEDLFRRRGGLALVIGRFLGPVAGFASLAAALSGMETRRFRIWNAVSAVPYAFAHVAIGYAAGDVLGRIGPMLTRMALFAVTLAAVIALIWFVSVQIRRGLPLLLGGLAAVRDMILALPPVAALVARHPDTADFIARRFRIGPFSGLTLTVLTAVFVYLAVAWADTALDFLLVPSVAQTDHRLARLMHAFWQPGPVRAFALITQMGDPAVVGSVLAGALGMLAVTRRWASMVQLCVALGGELITVWLLKGTFARPRPELGYFIETSGSFPSGHATLSVAFWGTLFVILWRERVLGPAVALVGGVITAFLIGFSRLYLVEHFLSDVVNGWLVGGMWLVIGLTVAEGLRTQGWRPPVVPMTGRIGATSIGLVAAAAAVWFALNADQPRAVAQTPPVPAVLDPVMAADTPSLPLEVRTLDGKPVVPVSLILAAPDLGTVEAAFATAGWEPAKRPTPSALVQAAWSDWRGKLDPGAPMLPLFWDGGPQIGGYHGPGGRIAARIWNSGARTDAGRMLYMVALSPVEFSGERWSVSAASQALTKALQPTTAQSISRSASTGRALDGTRWHWDGTVDYAALKAR